MFFDTHAHYDDEKFNDDRDEVIMRAYNMGVENILNVGINLDTSKKSIELARKYDFVYAAVGVYPHEIENLEQDYIKRLEDLINQNRDRVVAIGEIGLDYYYDFAPKDLQQKVFVDQINLAKKVGLPVAIHDRDAHGDTLDIIKQHGVSEVGGILHCFSGSQEMANEVLKQGLYIAIGGVVTFKNAKKIVDVIKNVPMDRLLIETDLPYLTPEPFRGKRNESAYLKYVVEKIAKIKDLPEQEIANITTNNAKRLFGIKSI